MKSIKLFIIVVWDNFELHFTGDYLVANRRSIESQQIESHIFWDMKKQLRQLRLQSSDAISSISFITHLFDHLRCAKFVVAPEPSCFWMGFLIKKILIRTSFSVQLQLCAENIDFHPQKRSIPSEIGSLGN